MPSSTFLYNDALVGKEIRLLKLLPGNWTDLLVGKLYKTTTNERYMALSYYWGSSAESHHMQIDGQSKPIRVNLERALRTIRHCQQTKPVILWVDAICINQDDVSEKECQVAFMYEISKGHAAFMPILAILSIHATNIMTRISMNWAKFPTLNFTMTKKISILSINFFLAHG